MTTMGYSRYDEDRFSERPVRLDKTEGHIVIEGKSYPAREIIEALAHSGYTKLRAVGDTLVLGSKRITPIFKSRQERAMATLCHGSLAYCCPLDKRCAQRDRALEILGLTIEDYQHMKGDSHHRFIEIAKGVPQVDRGPILGSRSVRSANRPASDYGYGSDDYRRDFDRLDMALQSGKDHSVGHRDTRSRTREYDRSRIGSIEHDIDRSYGETKSERALHDEMKSAVRELGDVCSMRSEPSTEGLGSLFNQGELSPFVDDSDSTEPGRNFCFTCGRTFKAGTRVCPYCGAMQ
jgi:hypothetical protein